ncbi:hypothetical protein ABW38_07680, partial [Achromobacter xylosoxidans]
MNALCRQNRIALPAPQAIRRTTAFELNRTAAAVQAAIWLGVILAAAAVPSARAQTAGLAADAPETPRAAATAEGVTTLQAVTVHGQG